MEVRTATTTRKIIQKYLKEVITIKRPMNRWTLPEMRQVAEGIVAGTSYFDIARSLNRKEGSITTQGYVIVLATNATPEKLRYYMKIYKGCSLALRVAKELREKGIVAKLYCLP